MGNVAEENSYSYTNERQIEIFQFGTKVYGHCTEHLTTSTIDYIYIFENN